MKKSSFAALVMGTVAGMMFALGMCMALLKEWNAFVPGVILGGLGILIGIAAWLVWRRMENKPPIRLSGKSILTLAVGIAGALLLGVGMCLCMVWNRMVIGILVGIAGIVALLCLIPLVKGFQD